MSFASLGLMVVVGVTFGVVLGVMARQGRTRTWQFAAVAMLAALAGFVFLTAGGV